MKRSTFASLLCNAILFSILSSCGNSGSENKPAADTATTTTETTEPTTAPPVNTTITTPTSMVMVTHKVTDFDKWLSSYESHDSMRLANGIHSYVIGRGFKDPNTVLVVVKVDDMAKAKAFAKSPDLKKAMQKGGVTGSPTMNFATIVFQDTANIGSTLRSITTFTVKDWAAWEKGFKEGQQERLDNGILTRAYGHDDMNDKKVMLATAVTDTAKAFTYYKSDMLKKRREAGGVVSEPVRFLYNIVKRY